MKHCPKCNRTYSDETLNFCLDDGEWLRDVSHSEEPETAILNSETPTRFQNSADTTPGAKSTVAGNVASGRNSVITGIVSVLLVTVLGIGGYWLYSNRTAKEINSIAVLPFQNRSGNSDADYLSDGLAESLVFRLSQLPDLKVSPMSSVIRYKGKENDISKVASDLGVDAVMSGWMVQRGDEIALSVELVDARNNKLIWGEQYDRKMAELLATQREIATTIAQKLELKLAGGGATGITKKYTNSNEAYQLYLKASYYLAKRTKPSMLQALDYYRQAIALDPNFALAYARMAEVYLNLPAYPYTSPSDAIPEAKKAVEKALELDPDLSEAHTYMGLYLVVYSWNWTEGEREFKRAIELDPNSADAHFRYGQVYLGPTGRYQEAVTEFQRALELEPLNLNAGNNLSAIYLYAGQKDLALAQARKTYDLEPSYPLGSFYLGLAYNDMGSYDEAIALSEKVLQGDPTSQMMLRVAGCAYAKSGRRADAERILEKFTEIGKTDYVMSYWVANIYAALGDKEKAFAELEKAYKNREYELYRLKADALMASLRDDPRYAAMLKRLNFPD